MSLGIFDIPFREYAAIPGISNTALGKLDISPATYKHWIENPDEGGTPAQKIGRIAHRAILEPDKFEAEFANAYAVKPADMKFSTSTGKAWRDEMTEQGREIITSEQEDFLAGAIKSIAAHPIAKEMLAAGKAEQSVVWEYNGIRCKARPDWITAGDTIVDLKTTRDASPREFHRSICDLKYYRQAAFYLDALNSLGVPVKHFCILAIEKDPPYLLSCHHISPEWIEIGREEYTRLLGRLVECKRTNYWPGYEEILHTAFPPDWKLKKLAA